MEKRPINNYFKKYFQIIESNEIKNQALFYIYNDGKVEKRIIVE